MNNFENLEKELLHLEEIINQCMNVIKTAPNGSVLITHRGNSETYHLDYYYKGQKEYLSIKNPENLKLTKQLIQKSYATKVLRTAMEQKAVIERFLASYNPNAIAEVFERSSEERKQYIEPFRTVEQKEKHIDEEEIRMLKEMRSLCDEILKRKAP
jgi:hypothetical protein